MNTPKGHIPLHPQTGLAFPYMCWQQRKMQQKLPYCTASCHHLPCVRTWALVSSAVRAESIADHCQSTKLCFQFLYLQEQNTFFPGNTFQQRGTVLHSTTLTPLIALGRVKQSVTQGSAPKTPTFYRTKETLTAVQKKVRSYPRVQQGLLQTHICWPCSGVLVPFQKGTRAATHLSAPRSHQTCCISHAPGFLG